MAYFIPIVNIVMISVTMIIVLTEESPSSQPNNIMEERAGGAPLKVDLDDFLSSFVDPCLLNEKSNGKSCNVCPKYPHLICEFDDHSFLKTGWNVQLQSGARCRYSRYGQPVNIYNIKNHCVCDIKYGVKFAGLVWFEAWKIVIDDINNKQSALAIHSKCLNSYRRDGKIFVPKSKLNESVKKYWIPLMGRKPDHTILPPLFIPDFEQING